MSKMNKNNIVLIGFMGVGKGTTARKLAKKIGRFTIDTDDLIVSFEKREIKKIFRKDGEPYFRALEQKVANWLENSVTNTIISCGGGFYKVNNLKSIGTVVYLKASFEWIYSRMATHPKAKAKFKKRPLFKEKQKAKELFDLRYPAYEEVADVIIDIEGKDIEQILQEIKSHIK